MDYVKVITIIVIKIVVHAKNHTGKWNGRTYRKPVVTKPLLSKAVIERSARWTDNIFTKDLSVDVKYKEAYISLLYKPTTLTISNAERLKITSREL